MAEKQSATLYKPGTVIRIPKDLKAIFEKENEDMVHVVFGGGTGPAPGYQMLSEALITRLASSPAAMKAILRDHVVVVVPREQIQM